MSEHPRLSEMAGIKTSWDDPLSDPPASFWPLNLVLIALGGAILAVAFYFLDTQDPRVLQNPWTYAVATPILLLLFSTLVSNLVSRVVEKSMQMAFLLSILIHLLLLVYAVNIVIFSRMWPDVLESLTAQREQLKRENLQANQYHRLASKTQSGRRPDYLQYVPTKHQPSEIEDAESPAIQLAKSERIEMISPSPALEKVASPHMLERERAATTRPAISQQAASLSRSELAEARRDTSAPEPADFQPREEVPEPLQASSASSPRRRGGSTAQSELMLAAPRSAAASEATNAERAAAESTPRSINLPPARLPNASTAAAAPRGSNPAEIAESQPSQARQPEAAASAAAASRRRDSSRSAAIQAPTMRPAPSEPASQTATAARAERQANQYRIPQSTAGDSRSALPRDTAGGTSGSTAPSSMRVAGPDALAANESSSGDLQSSPMEFKRRGGGSQRSAPTLPDIGMPQSSSWNGTPSLAGGLAGRSPSQIANAADRGSASGEDVAGLSGESGSIERAAIGLAGPLGTLSVPAEASTPGQAGQSDVVTAGGSESGEFGTGAARLSRSKNGGQSLPSPESLGLGASGAMGNAKPLADMRGFGELRRASESDGSQKQSESTEATSQLGQSGAVPRSQELAGGAPSSETVQPLGVEAAVPGEQSGIDGLQASNPLRRGQRGGETVELMAPTQLDVEAIAGPGGLASEPDLVGPILPRRRDLEATLTPPQIESQRFARQDVGGPLAAGRDVAIPKPAFQQRLERLQDRDAQDETAYEPQTEMAIEKGLAFLARSQRPDGSWRLQDFDTEVLMRSDTAATGLALLAFQGAGYTHKQFKYADNVDRAITFLAEHQASSGDLYIPQDPASDQNAWLYSHGIAALALCEAFGMTQDEELRPIAQRSIDFMVDSQDKRLGGWRYRPGAGTDTSVTGWFMMAIKSGQLAGLDVPKATFERIERYLDQGQASRQSPHLFRYNPFASDTPQQRHGLQPTAVMTSVGLLMRLYFDWRRDKPEMIAGADYLLEHLPEHGSRSASRRDTYYWYYATQVIFHMGGERWEAWHDRLYPMLISSQVAEGENEGSWDPTLPTPDLWARFGGRLYVTTMNLLSLEVSYRHLPLYEATAQ